LYNNVIESKEEMVMNKKIPKYLKLTFAASILGTSLLTGFPTNAYAEDTLTVLDVNATQNG
jgi:hypothetical protein